MYLIIVFGIGIGSRASYYVRHYFFGSVTNLWMFDYSIFRHEAFRFDSYDDALRLVTQLRKIDRNRRYRFKVYGLYSPRF